MAQRYPDRIAVAAPAGRQGRRKSSYRTVTFASLERDSSQIARGLATLGVRKGMRLVLLVRPGIEFISLVFGMLKSGAVVVLIDPGIGKRHLVRCLQDVSPLGFIAVPMVQIIRQLLWRRFPLARFNVTVGRPRLAGTPGLEELRAAGRTETVIAPTRADDPAAIIFTSGSTGPPKGVLYTHRNFDSQVEQIKTCYGIEPGEVDLPGFPLFGLFNAAMGTTTVIPDMNPTRPALVEPSKIIGAIHDWHVTQAFGSPAMWNRIGRYCEERRVRLPTLRHVMSAGAAVPEHVLQRMKNCIHTEGEVFTPYGATEALPVASISSEEVFRETVAQTRMGRGVCVGQRAPGIEWKVIECLDGPIEDIRKAAALPEGEIGELVVRGDVVTQAYVTRCEWNELSKIRDGDTNWHRMGDMGYLDDQDRFWFCGRKSQRVPTSRGVLYTECCEAIFNEHPDIYRTALVGFGSFNQQVPVIIAEPLPHRWPTRKRDRQRLTAELHALGQANPLTAGIGHFLLRPSLPVDIRHNSKIFREELARWARKKLSARTHPMAPCLGDGTGKI